MFWALGSAYSTGSGHVEQCLVLGQSQLLTPRGQAILVAVLAVRVVGLWILGVLGLAVPALVLVTVLSIAETLGLTSPRLKEIRQLKRPREPQALCPRLIQLQAKDTAELIVCSGLSFNSSVANATLLVRTFGAVGSCHSAVSGEKQRIGVVGVVYGCGRGRRGMWG